MVDDGATGHELLTAAQAAARLGLAIDTVRRLGRRGILTEVRPAGLRAVRYRAEDVERVAREGRA